MPLDFTSYGLDEDMLKKIQADYEKDVEGLKNKNNELIEREKTAKSSLEEFQIKATEEAENAKVALAEKEGDIEKYKAAVSERDEALGSIKREFQEKENSRIVLENEVKFASNIVDDPAAQTYMKGLFRDSVEVVEGQLRPKDVSLSLDQLTNNLVSDEANSRYIKANVGSGAGSAGSTGGGSASAGKADFSGSQQEKVTAAIKANPKLAALPVK